MVRNLWRNTFLVYNLAIGWYSLHLLAFWPGFISYDGSNYLSTFATGAGLRQMQWESFLYGGLVYWSLNTTESLLPLSLLQIALASLTSAYGYFLTAGRLRRPKLAALSAALVIFLSANAFMVNLTERDVIFTWLMALGTLLAFHRILSHKDKVNAWMVVLFTIILVSVSLLRKEGMFLGILSFVFLPSTSSSSALKFILALGLVFTSMALSFFADQLIGFGGYTNSSTYKSNTFYPSIVCILKKTGENSILMNRTRREIKLYPGSSGFFSRGKAAKIFRDLAMRHPLVFVGCRLDLLRQSLDQVFFNQHDTINTGVLFESSPTWPKLRSWLSEIRIFLENSLSLRYLFLTAVLSVFFCLQGALMSLFLKELRILGLLCLVPLSFLLVVLLLQPAAKSRYIYFIYVFGQLFFPVYIDGILRMRMCTARLSRGIS